MIRLGFELNGEEFGFDQLADRLRPIAKQNTILALAPAAPLPIKELRRVIDAAEGAGIRYLIFEKRPVGQSGGHGDPEADPFGEEIPVATESVEVAQTMEKKLNAITLPSIEFVDTSLKDALEFLRTRATELDQTTTDPGAKGVNLILKGDTEFQQTPISLTLSNVPLSRALQFTAQLANAEIRVDERAVFLQPKGEKGAQGAVLGDDPAAKAETERKLKVIVIPRIEFVETPLPDALAFLRFRSEELDATTQDAANKGINIVLSMNPDQVADPPRINLNLKNVTLGDALRYSSDLADLNLRVHGDAVVIEAKPEKKP